MPGTDELTHRMHLKAGTSAYQRRRFARDLDDWAKATAQLWAHQHGISSSPYRRLCNCCRSPELFYDEANSALRLHEMRCKSRLCPLCRRVTAYRTMQRTLHHLKRMNAPRFITLTVVSTDDPLRPRLRHLIDSFKRLRRSNVWKNHVHGGVYTIEVTYNPKLRQWHPHVHILCDGEYFPHRLLVDAWQQATGDSRIVHVAKVTDLAVAACYIASYVSKGNDPANFPEDRLIEWLEECRSIRFLGTFGTHHGIKADLVAVDDEERQPSRTYLGDPNELAAEAEHGDDQAAELLRRLWHIRKGRLRNDADGPAAIDPADVRNCARELRRWFNRRKDNHRGKGPNPRPDPGGHRRTDDRQLGLGQILAPPVNLGQI